MGWRQKIWRQPVEASFKKLSRHLSCKKEHSVQQVFAHALKTGKLSVRCDGEADVIEEVMQLQSDVTLHI